MRHQKYLSLTLRNVLYAVTAAERGNITAAARQLHVSQPAVSMAIASLEAHFGRRLFARARGQAVAVTAFGRSFLKEAREVLERAQALGQLGVDDAEASGEVRLGCFTDLSPYYVPKLIKQFALVKPAVAISFRDAGFDQLAGKLESGELDLALTYDLGLSARIDRVVLRTLAPYAMLPEDHPLTRRRKVTLPQLARYPVVLADQPLSWQSIVELFKAAGTEVASLTRTSSFELQRATVANGFGVGVAYTRPVGDRSYDGTGLAIREISECSNRQRVVLAWSRDLPLSAPGRAFRGFVAHAFDKGFAAAGQR